MSLLQARPPLRRMALSAHTADLCLQGQTGAGAGAGARRRWEGTADGENTKSRGQTVASKPFGVSWEPDNKQGARKARGSSKAGMGVSTNLDCLL